MTTTALSLAGDVREGELWERIDDRRIRCHACGHCCPISEGHAGVCQVRFHRDGKLYVPWGYVQTVQCDPIEKKPFYHVRPGAAALSFGMLGCDLHCAYCQNWVTSQAIRDPQAVTSREPATPRQLVQTALRYGAGVVVSTYNEPLITAEWAVEIFRHAKAAGLMTGFVSNGNATPQVLAYLRPWLDLYKVDLKCLDDRHYRQLGGRLQPILDSLRRIYEMGFWLEVVTLVVPGFNDSDEELEGIAAFLAGISRDIPWHVTAFHPAYRMEGPPATPSATLVRAANIGRQAGLHYVYAGNLPGQVGDLENTRCPKCLRLLVERRGFRVRNELDVSGSCPACRTPIPGRWCEPALVG